MLFAIAHLGKGGGVALQAYQLFKALQGSVDLQMVCLDAPGPHRALAQEPGVVLAGTLRFPAGVLTLRGALHSMRDGFDVFHVLDPFYACPAAFLARVHPRVVSLGTDPGLEIAGRFGPGFGAVTRAGMIPLLSESALVVNSSALAARFGRYRPHVIPNGLDRQKFEHLPTREEARRRFGLPTNRTLLAYVGKVIPEKRIEWVLEVTRRVPNTEAVIVGGYSEEYYGDRYYHALHSRYADIRDRTRFVGEVPWEQVPAYLAASDVFIFPSPWEGSPNAVMEAMAAGLPVVVSDIAAHREILEHGKTGFLDPDPDAMTTHVSDLAKDPAMRREIGSRARSVVFERYSVEASARAHLALYRKIAGA